MQIIKKSNQKKGKQTNRIIIVVCIIILLVIPLTLWLLNSGNSSNLIAYKGDSYTFYYPKGWTLTKNQMQDLNGTIFFLAPADSAPPKTPHVYVEVAQENDASINAMTQAFHVFNYKQTKVVVDGVQAQKYTEIVNSSEGTLHSTAYVFAVKGNLYLLELGYKQQAEDSQLEDEFTNIVTTFSTH